MQNGSGAEATTLTRDLRRLFVLGLLTALAILLCERWSEAGVMPLSHTQLVPIDLHVVLGDGTSDSCLTFPSAPRR